MTPEQLTGQVQDHIEFIQEHIGLHKQVVEPFKAMQQAAAKDGFNLQIVSAFRSYERQLGIFNAKLDGQRPVLDINNCLVDMQSLAIEDQVHAILLYSALPGASRHHWGTDIDVFDPELLSGEKLQLEPWEYERGGPLAPLNQWLENHCQQFDFYRPYQTYQGGIAPEPWHLSYRPLAEVFEQQMDIDVLNQCLTNKPTTAFETVAKLLPSIVARYVKITA
ncbi:M15 family metallopeptidase [Thalassotalea sp. PS06]|uniref:M15 family metallopeptidase n=1 Tax=Thalassotalea sp. PS06 TaxID=2594005 RepID=UPI001164CA1A|nr:M15 family metallopeptidase [Thalassotalea sp. PS06]QDP01477.1 M15 family metallopeptidase [Thalassotalea sp. PS06]